MLRNGMRSTLLPQLASPASARYGRIYLATLLLSLSEQKHISCPGVHCSYYHARASEEDMSAKSGRRNNARLSADLPLSRASRFLPQ